MKPAKFDYIRAESLAEVHAVLAAEGGDARVLAGGQTLVPMLSMRFARPKVLIDIMRIPALATIEMQRGIISIGAGVRQAELMVWLERNHAQPLLAAAMPFVGHAQTRSRGTVWKPSKSDQRSRQCPRACEFSKVRSGCMSHLFDLVGRE